MNMLGIENIASYIPEARISNFDRQETFGIDAKFIEQRIGVRQIALKSNLEETSDLCVTAFSNLLQKLVLHKEEIEVLVVITQNPDTNIPHTSAIVHKKLDLPETCACFDISLGCSGYVYGLSVVLSFMSTNGFKKGLLFTADPYSKIIDPSDKGTALLFGDAATVTLLSEQPSFTPLKFTYGTSSKEYSSLLCQQGKLFMNGREIFNFAAKHIPPDVTHLLRINQKTVQDIDKFVFHQGSKYILDTISTRLKLDTQKVVFDMAEYGNTVSSSIPIILEKEITGLENRLILISGFGVGLSWSSTLLERRTLCS